MSPRLPRRAPVCAALVYAVLFCSVLFCAILCSALAARPASAAPPPVFLPLVQPNRPPAPQLGPPAALRAGASAVKVTAGQPVTLSATLHDADGNLVPPGAALDVYLSVGGRDLIADRIGTAQGPVSYSAPWTPPAAGVYTVGAVAARAADGAKAGLPAVPFTLTVTPGPAATLDLRAHTFASTALPDFLVATLYDAAGNALPNPPPGGVTCASDDQVIQAGAAQPLPADFYSGIYGVPLDASRQLGIPLSAGGYGVAAVTCTHAASGATGAATVAAAPWEIHTSSLDGTPAAALPRGKSFALHLALRTPSGVEWTGMNEHLRHARTTAFELLQCVAVTPLDSAACTVLDTGAPDNDLAVQLLSHSSHGGLTPAVRVEWFAHPYVPATSTPFAFTVTDLDLTSPAGEIAYDPAPFDPWRTITVTLMPTRSLPLRVYVVAGAATAGEVEADLARVRRALAVNRAACLPALDLQAEVTEIPAQAWATLDADGDGFDRWDADGDGDFDGAADGDDFAAAVAAGYGGDAPGTISVYYVPQVRSAPALAGSGNALALDGARRDGWALFHLLAHALDLRADGLPDLAHGPGAPNDALNPDLPGPFLTPEQCATLNP